MLVCGITNSRVQAINQMVSHDALRYKFDQKINSTKIKNDPSHWSGTQEVIEYWMLDYAEHHPVHLGLIGMLLQTTMSLDQQGQVCSNDKVAECDKATQFSCMIWRSCQSFQVQQASTRHRVHTIRNQPFILTRPACTNDPWAFSPLSSAGILLV